MYSWLNSVHAAQNRNEGTTCFWSHGAFIILLQLVKFHVEM